MPEAAEQALKAEAAKKGLRGRRKNAYVYGTLRKLVEEREKEKADAR